MILGLDVSTSITGATVIDRNGEILFKEAWDTRNKRKFPTLWHKADFIEGRLRYLKVNRKFIIERVYVEQSLQAFRPGLSSAKTILTLAKFNGIISYLCRKMFKVEPEYVAAASARKACGITVPRGQKAKQVVLKFLLDNEPEFSISYTKQGNPKPGTYDIADSIIVARAGLKYWNDKNSKS